jgi:hypothetical protein
VNGREWEAEEVEEAKEIEEAEEVEEVEEVNDVEERALCVGADCCGGCDRTRVIEPRGALLGFRAIRAIGVSGACAGLCTMVHW